MTEATDEPVDQTLRERTENALRYIGIHSLIIRGVGVVEPDAVVEPGHPAHEVLVRRNDAIVVTPAQLAADKAAADADAKKAAAAEQKAAAKAAAATEQKAAEKTAAEDNA